MRADPATVIAGFRGAVFDLDGTLLDSMGVWGGVDRDFFARHGLILPSDYQKAITPMSYTDAAAYTVRRFGLTLTPAEVAEEWHDMAREAYALRVPLKPGAERLLRALSGAGVKLALATGSGRELFEPALRRFGVYELFDAFVTLCDVPRGKRFPDIYLRAARLLALAPEDCVAFEDIPDGICGAKAAGMRAVGVFDEASAGERARITALADGYLMDFCAPGLHETAARGGILIGEPEKQGVLA